VARVHAVESFAVLGESVEVHYDAFSRLEVSEVSRVVVFLSFCLYLSAYIVFHNCRCVSAFGGCLPWIPDTLVIVELAMSS
jgi:hypothetical protein